MHRLRSPFNPSPLQDLRVTAAILLNSLAHTLGPELVSQFVLPEVICLAEDPVFRVRKAVAAHCGAIAVAAGPVATAKRLLPAFKTLCKDDIWGVRKACAEAMVPLSRALEPSLRLSELAPLYERLCTDASKWVRAAAYQWAGTFIATLPGPKVPASLLAHYVRAGMAGCTPLNIGGAPAPVAPSGAGAGSAAAASTGLGPSGASSGNLDFDGGNVTDDSTAPAAPAPAAAAAGTAGTVSSSAAATPGAALLCDLDLDLGQVTAFAFPAVALTLGRARWAGELRPLWTALTRDVQRVVRRPLACALHELARILGPELTDSDLLPVFDLYLQDNSEAVRQGVMRHAAAFLAVLPPPTREAYLPVLAEMRDGCAPRAWRARRALAGQVGALGSLFSPLATFSIVTPWALGLLLDPVADVRHAAATGWGPLLVRVAQADPGMLLQPPEPTVEGGGTAPSEQQTVPPSPSRGPGVAASGAASSTPPSPIGASLSSITPPARRRPGQGAGGPAGGAVPPAGPPAPLSPLLLDVAQRLVSTLAQSRVYHRRALFVRLCAHLATGQPPPVPVVPPAFVVTPAPGSAAADGAVGSLSAEVAPPAAQRSSNAAPAASTAAGANTAVASASNDDGAPAPCYPPLPPRLFVRLFLPHLLALAADPVPNVRLALAALIGSAAFREAIAASLRPESEGGLTGAAKRGEADEDAAGTAGVSGHGASAAGSVVTAMVNTVNTMFSRASLLLPQLGRMSLTSTSAAVAASAAAAAAAVDDARRSSVSLDIPSIGDDDSDAAAASSLAGGGALGAPSALDTGLGAPASGSGGSAPDTPGGAGVARLSYEAFISAVGGAKGDVAGEVASSEAAAGSSAEAALEQAAPSVTDSAADAAVPVDDDTSGDSTEPLADEAAAPLASSEPLTNDVSAEPAGDQADTDGLSPSAADQLSDSLSPLEPAVAATTSPALASDGPSPLDALADAIDRLARDPDSEVFRTLLACARGESEEVLSTSAVSAAAASASDATTSPAGDASAPAEGAAATASSAPAPAAPAACPLHAESLTGDICALIASARETQPRAVVPPRVRPAAPSLRQPSSLLSESGIDAMPHSFSDDMDRGGDREGAFTFDYDRDDAHARALAEQERQRMAAAAAQAALNAYT